MPALGRRRGGRGTCRARHRSWAGVRAWMGVKGGVPEWLGLQDADGGFGHDCWVSCLVFLQVVQGSAAESAGAGT